MYLDKLLPVAYIQAADTLKYTVTGLTDDEGTAYPASAWTIYYVLKSKNNTVTFNSTAASNNIDHSVTIAGTVTAAYAVDKYSVQVYVKNTSTQERHTLASGVIEVKPDLASLAAGTETLSENQIIYKHICDILSGKTDDVIEMSIGNRSFKSMTISDLLKWKAYYANAVKREQGKATGKRIQFGFI